MKQGLITAGLICSIIMTLLGFVWWPLMVVGVGLSLALIMWDKSKPE